VGDEWALLGNNVLELIKRYAPTKLELFVLIVVLLVAHRVPALLQHRREMRVIRNDFELRSNRQQAKIAAEQAKRKHKSQKGVGK
jgi:hypothetical protein